MELVVTSCPVVGMGRTSECGATGIGTAELIDIERRKENFLLCVKIPIR